MGERRITTPFDDVLVESLTSGDRVLLSGTIYTGRDAAHKRLAELVAAGQPLPVDLSGQVIYYVGPTPAKPGRVIGSAGPTTSGRMDAYAPALFALGLKGTIGKGLRSPEVVEAMRKHRAVYFGAVGGAAALIARCIKQARVTAYPELGPEAIYELQVADFPLTVINDCRGGDQYAAGRRAYACAP
ncbi:MAG: Fe-S-containing hydro-lyase [Peptococcaceae bacterium]|jgi:fumarate hydratase subunit beta|nr:Fe-S-containing hydro-lyase [Peptococcaceae bacterium]